MIKYLFSNPYFANPCFKNPFNVLQYAVHVNEITVDWKLNIAAVIYKLFFDIDNERYARVQITETE